MEGDRPFVTVIIPVYEGRGALERCLTALNGQTWPSQAFEIVVVDNGGNGTLDWVSGIHPQARVIRESQPGSYAARNAGVKTSCGDVLAFTDADCVPSETWIEKGVAALESSRAGLVGGHVEFTFENAAQPRIVELYDSVRNLNQEAYIHRVRYAATANMFTFRRVFDDVGLFDEALRSGGDREWGQRVSAKAYKLVFCRDAVVRHPARNSVRQVYSKVARVTGGHQESIRKEDNYLREFAVAVAGDLVPPVRFAWRLAKDPRVPGWRNKVGVVSIFVLEKLFRLMTRIRLVLGREAFR